MTPAILQSAYNYWFGQLLEPRDFPSEKAKLWFERSDATDDHIRKMFGAAIPAVANELWNLDALARQEQVGLIIFLDQFPRNIFRETGEAFAYDARARTHANALLAHNPNAYFPVELVFLYLPLEHSEAMPDQERSVGLYEKLATRPETAGLPFYAATLDFANKHRELITRFGRFPHRNAVLGRVSTPAELAFLAEHGRGY